RQARSVDVVSAYQWAWDADPAKGQNVGQGLYSTKQAQPDSPAFGDFVRHTGDICKRTHIDFVLASACTADLRAKRAQPTDEESQQLRRLIEERISSDPPATTESLNRKYKQASDSFGRRDMQSGQPVIPFGAAERLVEFSFTLHKEMQTLFADDFLSAFRLADSRDLGLMCARVGCLFEALREAGMQVNPEKSKLMLRAAGNTLTKWIRKHSFLHEGSKFIKFATPFSAVKIGLADSIEYLGACLSFQSFEKQTAQLRIKQARASVSRLCKVLFKKRGLSMNQRVKVYLTCIRSTALYSISAIGATEESLQLLSRMEAHHIRCIAGSARHITFESTADLYVRRADLCAAVSSPVSGA
ncbi:unnamed protein product, partial [Symbiodinium pilosum]